MPPKTTLALALALAILTDARAGAPGGHPRRLHIVATLPDLAAMAREVGGDRVSVAALLSPSMDPFLHAPHPDESALLARADLLLAAGGPLEAGWLPRLIVSAHNPRLAEYLDMGRLLSRLPEGERVEVPGSYALADPRSMSRAAGALAQELSAMDESAAPSYRHAAALFAAELAQREQRWLAQLAPLRGQKVVSYDDTFSAFLGWAGLVEIAVLASAPGMPPSPLSVLRALRLLRGQEVRIILQREYQPAHAVRLLREKTGAQVVVVPLGARHTRGERYLDAMEGLVQALLAAHRAARGGP